MTIMFEKAIQKSITALSSRYTTPTFCELASLARSSYAPPPGGS
jgi:hypothetical protein